MNERLDALSVREDKNGKAWFTKIGAAFPNKDGKGYTLMLDAMPAPTDGQFKIMLRTPLPKDGQQGQQGNSNRRQAGSGSDDWGGKEVFNSNSGWADDLNDDIAF